MQKKAEITPIKKAITACQILFESKYHISKGILSLLCEEDVRLAFAKKIAKLKKKYKCIETENAEKKPITLINELYAQYCDLRTFIRNRNKARLSDRVLFAECIGFKSMFSHTPSKVINYHKNEALVRQRSFFYKGKILPRKMRFGTYLYYRGIISHSVLMDALYWQKMQRPLIGQITMQTGILKPGDFSRVLFHTKSGTPFGEIACRHGLTKDKLISAIVDTQKKYDKPLGKYFIEQGILNMQQVRILIDELSEHNSRFGNSRD